MTTQMNDTQPQPTVTRTCKRIRLENLRHKDWTRHGIAHAGRVLVGHHADIVAGESVRLYGHETNAVVPHDYDITFKIGDTAIYGGYNLYYTGEVVGIGEKTVRIQAHGERRVHSLDIATFSEWNRNYSEERVRARNDGWMD